MVATILPNADFRDHTDCSYQERIVFDAWVNAEIIYGVTPQYFIEVNPRLFSGDNTQPNFILVVLIPFYCFRIEQLGHPLPQAANELSDLLG
jgi:hypothetical protein